MKHINKRYLKTILFDNFNIKGGVSCGLSNIEQHRSHLHTEHADMHNQKSNLKILLEKPLTRHIILALIFLDLTIVFTEIILDLAFSKNSSQEPLKTILCVFWAISLTIIVLFVIEILLHVVAYCFFGYFKSKVHVLDAIIVLVSLTLMSVFTYSKQETISELVGLLVLLRTWKVVRLMVASTVVMEMDKERAIQALRLEIAALRGTIAEMRDASRQDEKTTEIETN